MHVNYIPWDALSVLNLSFSKSTHTSPVSANEISAKKE